MAKKEKEVEKTAMKPATQEWGLRSFDDMDNWFNDFFQHRGLTPFWSRFPGWADVEASFKGQVPKVDVVDRENEILVRAELPGVKKDDLEVSLTDHTLSIRATTAHEEKEEKGEYFRREIRRGEFQRTLPLPSNIDQEKVNAVFNDGILELKLPKLESATRKTIKVE